MVPSQPKPWLSPEATAAVEMIAGLPRAAHPPMGHEVVCPKLQAFSERVLFDTKLFLNSRANSNTCYNTDCKTFAPATSPIVIPQANYPGDLVSFRGGHLWFYHGTDQDAALQAGEGSWGPLPAPVLPVATLGGAPCGALGRQGPARQR